MNFAQIFSKTSSSVSLPPPSLAVRLCKRPIKFGLIQLLFNGLPLIIHSQNLKVAESVLIFVFKRTEIERSYNVAKLNV
jgi:hypothetical protein